MLLRSIRSRAATTKQALMADQSSPTHTNYNKPFKPFTTTHHLSPTSTLDTKPFSSPKSPKSLDQHHSKGIALLLVDILTDDHSNNNKTTTPKPCNNNKMVIFGTNLGVQIPPSNSNTQSSSSYSSPRVLTPSELELSEDYTCVISHGPNPKTTHIFDNCIIDAYFSLSNKTIPPDNNFLSFCYTCNKNLQRKNDIYIYRGEKAFCSEECRHQEMMLDGFH